MPKVITRSPQNLSKHCSQTSKFGFQLLCSMSRFRHPDSSFQLSCLFASLSHEIIDDEKRGHEMF